MKTYFTLQYSPVLGEYAAQVKGVTIRLGDYPAVALAAYIRGNKIGAFQIEYFSSTKGFLFLSRSNGGLLYSSDGKDDFMSIIEGIEWIMKP